ncbi:unnamed protein product [Haemonchus placei]|uniref:Transporter n=1 Tax=Haemonchus placei TaxID=6290 RepID=A0A0N4W734_HAEPC|nr:unnamed protein product [Haemonchus placei]
MIITTPLFRNSTDLVRSMILNMAPFQALIALYGVPNPKITLFSMLCQICAF